LAPFHHFEITASYGPAQLFATLKKLCENREGRVVNATFEFDWMKRGVWIEAESERGATMVAERLAKAVDHDAAPGQILVGRLDKAPSGRPRQSIGILLQTPDVYTEVMSQTLTEFGLRGILTSADGTTLEVPVTSVNKGLGYADLIARFPLPRYLRVADRGIVEQ
jgi:hypothetical protein